LFTACNGEAGIDMLDGWYGAIEKTYTIINFWGRELNVFRAYWGVLEVLDWGLEGGEIGTCDD
jgi:hypothetical protein